jgi:hypothetical protein
MTNAEKQARYRARRRAREAAGDDAISSLVRACLATGLSKFTPTQPAEFVRRTWDDECAGLILRAAVSPASLSNTPALTQVTAVLLDALVPLSAGADLLQRGVRLNFAGVSQINVPSIAISVCDFVGEGQPIPVVQAPTTPGPVLTPHKLAVISTLSREIMESSNAEQLVRQVLVESTGPAIDKVLFSTSAPGTDRPAGLLSGIVSLTPGASGPSKGEVLVDDIQKLATAVGPVAGNGDLVIVASPDAAAALVLRLPSAVQWPVLTSSSLAARTVIVIATAAVVSAVEGSPQVDAGRHAEIHRETVPQEIVTAAGTTAAPVGSVFQTDQIALRLRWPISWALRDTRGVAWMQNVNW